MFNSIFLHLRNIFVDPFKTVKILALALADNAVYIIAQNYCSITRAWIFFGGICVFLTEFNYFYLDVLFYQRVLFC